MKKEEIIDTLVEDTITAGAMAEQVDFLKKKWERNCYAYVLTDAMQWGRQKDKENKEYREKMRKTNINY